VFDAEAGSDPHKGAPMRSEGEWAILEGEDPPSLVWWVGMHLCLRCGATVLPIMAETHADWHSANG